jgi:predicted O-methyltransferase YrrM
MTESPRFALAEVEVREVLEAGWRRAARQAPGMLGELLGNLTDRLLGRPPTLEREVRRLRDLYVPVSPKQGRLLYLLARARGARRIVEFGTSFGLSTIHLAAAVRDNGGGQVVGTELEPRKVAVARRNLEAAGLSDWAEIREGNALDTLSDPGGPVDLVFLDGFAPLYLPVLELVAPQLSPGAVVVADNLFTFRRQLAEYVAYMRDPSNGFLSIPLFLKDGTELSVRL